MFGIFFVKKVATIAKSLCHHHFLIKHMMFFVVLGAYIHRLGYIHHIDIGLGDLL